MHVRYKAWPNFKWLIVILADSSDFGAVVPSQIRKQTVASGNEVNPETGPMRGIGQIVKPCPACGIIIMAGDKGNRFFHIMIYGRNRQVILLTYSNSAIWHCR